MSVQRQDGDLVRHNDSRFSCGDLPKPPPSKPIERYPAAAEAFRAPSAANAGYAEPGATLVLATGPKLGAYLSLDTASERALVVNKEC